MITVNSWRSAAIALCVAASASAQTADSAALVRRAAEFVSIMNGAPASLDTVFAPAFLAQVPAAQFKAQLAQLTGPTGKAERAVWEGPAPTGGGAIRFQVWTANGFTIPMTLHVSPSAPNLVDGLFLAPPVRASATFDDLAKDMRALPGHASLLVARVDGSRLVPIVSVDTGRALGIGSAFKLYVLGELVKEIAAGTRHWNDVITIDSGSRSLPSGMLHSWPANSPVTVQTLAQLMISISDNTAADRLLRLLGREKVEAIQSVLGNTHASLNMPFLTTREMFALKTSASAPLMRRYINGGGAERRTVLGEIAKMPYAQVSPDFSKGPVVPDSIEWFASAADLGRTMVWLRDQGSSGAPSTVRDVLSVNRGLQFDSTAWPYVGFKGGSEPGVLAMSFLMRRSDGQWFVLVGEWNDRDRNVDPVPFAGIMTRAAQLMATAH